MGSTKPSAAVDSSNSPPKENSLLAKSARGASLLIILQVASRGLTFAVNQILLRFLSPQLLAISTQLEVYSITVLLFSRESLRIALQRQGSNDVLQQEKKDKAAIIANARGQIDSRSPAGRSQAIVNLSYISIFLGIFFAFTGAWIWTPEARVLETPYFKEALIMYAIATFLELLAEPCFVVVQQHSEFGIRARAESIATFLRCIVTCASAAWAAQKGIDIGVLPFAIGQWVYAISLPVVYYWKTWNISSKGGFSLLLRPIFSIEKSEFLFNYFSRPLLWLGCSLFAQSVIKHFLTQGDTLIISYLASLETQGQFALASNYGGLIARLVFQPIEESSRSYFAKVLSTTSSQDQSKSQEDIKKNERQKSKEDAIVLKSKEPQPSKQAIETASSHLHLLLHFYTLLGLTTITLAPTLLPILLSPLLTTSPSTTSKNPPTPSKWATTLPLLSTYTHYIPLLSLNGLFESFFTSIATPPQLRTQTLFLTLFSLLYILISYLFLNIYDLGAKGLVYANCVNMAGRIVWSGWFIRGWLRERGGKLDFRRVFPGMGVLAVGAGTWGVLREVGRGVELVEGVKGGLVFLTSGRITHEFWELGKLGVIVGSFLIVLAVSERELLLNAYRSVRSR